MDWKVSEYLEMQVYAGYREKNVNIFWVLRGILMGMDKYSPKYYFPPVPMDIGTFYFLRRN